MEKAISGYSSRMDWLKTELYKDIERCTNDYEIRKVIAWYLTYGFSIGIDKNDLIDNIKSDERVIVISMSLTDEEILKGKKPPTLRRGDEVEVIVNAKNLTFHRGVIYNSIWHYKEKGWFYYIHEDGKKISKRYCDTDLRLLKKANDKEDTI